MRPPDSRALSSRTRQQTYFKLGPREPCDPTENVEPEPEDDDDVEIGFVYLLKSGRHYKIGKSNAAGRREREIALQLPERVTMIHTIRTDDASGIEDYWHRRFESKRLNGEWFELSAADVRGFRRRKFM